jgi:hypothetical protein
MKIRTQQRAALLGVCLAIGAMIGILFFGRHWYFEVAGFVGVGLMIVSVVNILKYIEAIALPSKIGLAGSMFNPCPIQRAASPVK